MAKQEISSEWNMQIGRCVEGDHRYILQMLYKNIQNEIQQYDTAAAAAPKWQLPRSNSALSAMAKAKSWPQALEFLAIGLARAQQKEAFAQLFSWKIGSEILDSYWLLPPTCANLWPFNISEWDDLG